MTEIYEIELHEGYQVILADYLTFGHSGVTLWKDRGSETARIDAFFPMSSIKSIIRLDPDPTEATVEEALEYDFKAEEGLIGMMLLEPAAHEEARDNLLSVMVSDRWRATFVAIRSMYVKGLEVNPVTVAAHLDGKVSAGDLRRLQGDPPSIQRSREYAGRIRAAYVRRNAS